MLYWNGGFDSVLSEQPEKGVLYTPHKVTVDYKVYAYGEYKLRKNYDGRCEVRVKPHHSQLIDFVESQIDYDCDGKYGYAIYPGWLRDIDSDIEDIDHGESVTRGKLKVTLQVKITTATSSS